MGVCRRFVFGPSRAAGAGVGAVMVAMLAFAGGCQTGVAPASHRDFKIHAAQVPFTGLKPAARAEAVRATIAAPEKWTALAPYQGTLYTHQQWRSPTAHTGVGIVSVGLPLPLGSSTVMWL